MFMTNHKTPKVTMALYPTDVLKRQSLTTTLPSTYILPESKA